MSNIKLDLDQISRLLFDLTNEQAGNAELASFFTLLHHLGLKGLGIGGGGGVEESGEAYAIAHVRQILEQRYPDTPLVLFDVGANVGGFLGKLYPAFIDCPHRIFSFEPSPATFAKLSATAVDMQDVFLYNIGCGATDGAFDLFTDRPGSAIASLYQRRIDHYATALTQRETVTLRALDSFCAEHKIERIHYLKMDVEGHEMECLKGAKTLLADGRIDFIQFEFGGANIDSRIFFQDFWYILENYQIFRIMKNGLYEINKYSEFEEIFVIQNFLAMRRKN